MRIERLLEVVGDAPVFESSLLLAGNRQAAGLQRQLCRWTQARVLIQLRRGVYCLAPPYRKVSPHPFVLASALHRPSYVSLQSALAYWQLIPEHVPVVTSVTTRRPCGYRTPLGRFHFRHVKKQLFSGYRLVEVAPGQHAFLASPEKALLDLIHLEGGSDSTSYLTGLRIQNGEQLDLDELQRQAEAAGRPKLGRAVHNLRELVAGSGAEYEAL